MPVPWHLCEQCKLIHPQRIQDAENRGITVQQLRDLRLLLQRLCKVGLLRRQSRLRPAIVEADPAQAQAAEPARLNWYEINMYEIRDLLIKPLIEHHCMPSKEKTSSPREGGGPHCGWRVLDTKPSWVEVVADRPQYPKVLISHYWGGSFRDFMAVVDELTVLNNMRTETVLWVCTFAIRQFGEEFGSRLLQSPFAKAVQQAKKTVLIVDRMAGSLERIWCALEIHLTVEAANAGQEKTFEIFTPSGKVGTSRVSSGPLVKKIATWDVKACQASEPAQRRQILNYLANPRIETKGLQCHSDGQELLVVDGWRTLLAEESQEADKQAQLRRTGTNGKIVNEHESWLFQEYAGKFAAINDSVQKVVKTSGQGAKSEVHPIDGEGTAYTGVTLGRLRVLFQEIQSWCEGSSTIKWDTVTFRHLSFSFFNKGQSYWETPFVKKQSVDEGTSDSFTPRFIIEHPWDNLFKDTITAIEWFVDARRLGDDAVFWMDAIWLCEEFFTNTAATAVERMKQVYREAEGSVVCLSKRQPDVCRAWLVLGMQLCLSHGKMLDFSCETGMLACSLPLPGGGYEFGRFHPEIAMKLMEFNVSSSRASNRSNEELIKDTLRTGEVGEQINLRIRRTALGPVLRDAAANGAVDRMREVLNSARISLSSPCFAGPLGETASHIAAACGHTETLRCLLDAVSDPNAEDHIRETPLHYAALAGETQCVKILLSRGADADVESIFAETPLQVAKQNVAAYLGKKTDSCQELLEAWQNG